MISSQYKTKFLLKDYVLITYHFYVYCFFELQHKVLMSSLEAVYFSKYVFRTIVRTLLIQTLNTCML